MRDQLDCIETEEAQKLAEEHKMEYFEASAFAECGIEECMGAIIKQVYDHKLVPQIQSLNASTNGSENPYSAS